MHMDFFINIGLVGIAFIFLGKLTNKENKNIVIDINPNSGFFGSNIARKNFLKYVIDCSKDIINNYGL